MAAQADCDVIVVGGGVAGRTAAMFTARHGFDTRVFDTGSSIIRRNAHLENFPGFPDGVNARHLLDLLHDQLDRAGATLVNERVDRIVQADHGFTITTDRDGQYSSRYVIAATKNEVDYLDHLDGVGIIDRGSAFIDTDERGRTGVSGLYAAGRLAEKPHQAIVCAGHGAEVAVTVLEDDARPYYHDWVVPDGYFSDRGRDVPPGCEEIDEDERIRREKSSLAYMCEAFGSLHSDPQETHPSLVD